MASGEVKNVAAVQRAQMNILAAKGSWTRDMEKAA